MKICWCPVGSAEVRAFPSSVLLSRRKIYNGTFYMGNTTWEIKRFNMGLRCEETCTFPMGNKGQDQRKEPQAAPGKVWAGSWCIFPKWMLRHRPGHWCVPIPAGI